MTKISVEKAFAVAAILVIGLLNSPTWAGTVDLGKHDPGEIARTCGDEGGSLLTTHSGNYGCQKGNNIVACSYETHQCTGSCPNCSGSAARRAGKSGVVGVLGGGAPVATRGGSPAGPKKPKPVALKKPGGSKTIAIHQNNVQHSGGRQHK